MNPTEVAAHRPMNVASTTGRPSDSAANHVPADAADAYRPQYIEIDGPGAAEITIGHRA